MSFSCLTQVRAIPGRYVGVHVRHLRTKLEPDPRKPIYIKTVYGAGYCLELPVGSKVESAKQEFVQARKVCACFDNELLTF